MNQKQLEMARAHYEELIYGMSNIDVKALGLREFCHRKWRMKNKIRLTLWALTPEWISYIEEKNREDVASISKQSKISDSCSDFSTFVQEVSSVETVDAHSDPLLAKMENSLRIGECHITSTFDRATLLFRYYERLVGDGLTMIELIDADLVGMLSQYLDYKRCDKRFYIKDPRKQLNLMYLIHKYYKKDSSEYESFVAEISNQESSKSGATNLINMQTTKSAETIKPKEIEVDESEVIEFRGERFIKTSWNGISVLKHEATGYYNMSSACHEYTRRINDWRRNRKTIELLEIASEVLHLPIEVSEAGFPASGEMNCLLYRIRSGGSNVAEIGNQIQGYYIHPDLFHSFAEWISPEYAIKVSRLMNLINERNQLMQQSLEQTIENLTKEISDLKAKNESKNHSLNELEAELVSRAVKIEELASEIEDLTTPIDTRLAPPTIYAKYIDDNHVQLKHSSSELGPNVRTLRRESFNGAIECLKQAKAKLKEQGLLTNVNGKLLIENSHIDKAFDLIHEIKDRKNESRADRNKWFEAQLALLQSRKQTPQLEGKKFELEYIQQHEELTPWALVPTDIKNRLNETSKDKGIDAVELHGDELLSIIQIKHHISRESLRGSYLRKEELQTFFNKCSQERYKNVNKRLLLHNCKISDKLKDLIHSHGIEIEVLN